MNDADNPAQSDARTRLLEAATTTFLEEGYRASVLRIAARAGVAKQTLYNYFPRKDDLFCEVIRRGASAMLVSLDNTQEPLRERLLRFANTFRECLLSSKGIAFHRAIAAEAGRFPELAAAYYVNGPQHTAQRLAAVLEQAMAKGALRSDNPLFAAEMLQSMLLTGERTRRLLSQECAMAPVPADTGDIIDLFLRAYAPQTHA